MKKDNQQMVDDDQIENVGIMSGFMDEADDDLEELLSSFGEDEDEGEDDDESDIAKMLDRRPDAPEILMNNLRGDYRSIDARREELADLVGYNAAAETPDSVLAMLQPVLAKQGVASLPAPPMPAVPGGVESLPAAQGPMPGASTPPPMEMAPPAPVGMKKGGIIQLFQDGGEAEASDESSAYPADLVAQYLNELRSQPSSPLPDVGARTRELTPMYAEILGTQDKDAVRSQMLFDIAQAALGFAGNVNPQGQPLTGSFAARLAGAASGLPGQISARSQAMRAAEAQARLAALQQAQGERTAAQEANLQREKDYRELLLKTLGQKNYRTLSTEEKAAAGLPTKEPWQIEVGTNQYSLPGGRAATTTINTGAQTLTGMLGADFADTFKNARTQAEASQGTLRAVEEIAPLLESNDLTFNGTFSNAEVAIARLGTKLGVTEGDTQQRLANTVVAMQNLAQFELQAAQAMRGQGPISDSERTLIRRASAGDLATMTAREVRELVGALEKTARWKIENYNQILDRVQTQVGAEEPLMSMYPKIELSAPIIQTTTPTTAPSAPPVDAAAIQAELERRRRQQQQQ